MTAPRSFLRLCLLSLALGSLSPSIGALYSPAETEAPPETKPALHMKPWQAIVLGVVEGLTEYLPVSSTGHLILTERALGLADSEETRRAANAYAVVIQIGAILAVAGVCHHDLAMMGRGLAGRSPEGKKLLINLLIAFAPAALIGLTLVGPIKQHLFGLWPVSFAWAAGGLALILWGDKSKDGPGARGLEIKDLTPKKALIIGVLQTVAVWPGTSRSLVTILGGRLVGLRLRDAVVFSFILGMLTLTASTCYDALKEGPNMVRSFGLGNLLLGIGAAWVSAWIAVKGMVEYLKRHGLKAFGAYRLALAGVSAALILAGVLHP